MNTLYFVGTDTCETILSTDSGKGIKLNVSPTVMKTSPENFLCWKILEKKTFFMNQITMDFNVCLKWLINIYNKCSDRSMGV